MNKAEIALTKMLMSTDPACVADACAVKCLKIVETKEINSAATDGVVLLVNPDFLEGLSIDQVCGLLVHEVCHVRFGHTARFKESGYLDHNRANKSMDREINPLVRAAGYALPPDGCYPSGIGQEDGLSWEGYYPHEREDNQQGKGNGKANNEIADGAHPAGSLVERFAPELVESWEQTPQDIAEQIADDVQAAAEESKILGQEQGEGRKAGTGTGDERLKAELIISTDCRWQDVVIGMIATRASGESIADWGRPSRRSIAQGVYRPARRKVSGYKLALVLDVSGSCIGYFDEWQSMARELVEVVPEVSEMDIYYHDEEITGTENWVRRNGDEVTVSARGGGGTDFRPVLAEVERSDVDGVILFTDSEGPWPKSCSLDCVTVQPPRSSVASPIGVTVRITSWH